MTGAHNEPAWIRHWQVIVGPMKIGHIVMPAIADPVGCDGARCGRVVAVRAEVSDHLGPRVHVRVRWLDADHGINTRARWYGPEELRLYDGRAARARTQVRGG